ncbi:MAG: hypothetical protein ABL872_11640 [Lacibacter sp.]
MKKDVSLKKPKKAALDSINKAIEAGDELCKKHPHYHQPNMVSVILFKEKPEAALVQQLQQAGFHLPTIHKNPYV